MEINSKEDSPWISLEPEILSNIAKRLCRRDTGSMRLACKTWQQSISSGVLTMAVVSLEPIPLTDEECGMTEHLNQAGDTSSLSDVFTFVLRGALGLQILARSSHVEVEEDGISATSGCLISA